MSVNNSSVGSAAAPVNVVVRSYVAREIIHLRADCKRVFAVFQ